MKTTAKDRAKMRSIFLDSCDTVKLDACDLLDDIDELLRVIERLHNQYGHPSDVIDCPYCNQRAAHRAAGRSEAA